MKAITKALILTALPLLAAGASADVTQDCILEGTVDKKKAEQMGSDVYIAFHSATRAEKGSECKLNRRNRVEFKASKDTAIENAPDGAKVQYRYTEKNNQNGEWELMGVSM